jgi:hypothetical protein
LTVDVVSFCVTWIGDWQSVDWIEGLGLREGRGSRDGDDCMDGGDLMGGSDCIGRIEAFVFPDFSAAPIFFNVLVCGSEWHCCGG